MLAEPLDNAEATRRILLVANAQDKNRIKAFEPKAKTYLDNAEATRRAQEVKDSKP